MKLHSKLVEAANRGEISAILIRNSYRVYMPDADVDGVDLVLRDPCGRIFAVQQKARPTCNKKYCGKKISMLFPEPHAVPLKRSWFLVDHDELFNHIKLGWTKDEEFIGRSFSKMTKKLHSFLIEKQSELPMPEKADDQQVEEELD